MKLMSYRNLAGIGLTPGQIRALAASKTVPGELNDQGEPTTRPACRPIISPARIRTTRPPAPPITARCRLTIRLIVSAREGGADYIYALMLGYVDPPPGVKVPDGLYYNKWFPGHQIHMPAPLQADSVTYADGTKATLEQEAHDVATFLTFASNPHMEERKHLGVRMVGFFALMCGRDIRR